MQAGVGCIEFGVEFLLCAGRIVAQLLHLVCRFRPDALQYDRVFAEQFFAVVRNIQQAALVQAGHFMHILQAGGAAGLQHIFHILDAHLHHRPQLFIKQCADRIAFQFIQINIESDVRCKRHLAQGCQQAAV